MLLRNVRLGDSVTDLRINDGVITAIGAGATATDAGEQIDAGGRWISPGLWDNHVHFTQWTLGSRRLDISAASSAREAAVLVGQAMARDAAGSGPFVAVGFRDGLWPDAPNRHDLDAHTGPRPAILVSGDLHAVWLNSPALALYGYTGHPTGLIREDEAFAVTRRIDEVDPVILDGWARTAARQAAARGVVGVIDYEMSWNHETWVRRMAAGADELRVEFGIYTQHLERAIELGLRTGDRIGELLSVGGYKVLTDGSLNTRTAYCYDEYPGLEGHIHSHGLLTVPPSELLPQMRRAVEGGITPTVHAIGDHANTLALDAFQQLGVRGRIEHAQMLAESDLPRFAALGVIASVQPEHAMDDRDVADRYWAGRTARTFPLRSLLDAGATLALGSDCPVAPLDPWVTIAAAVFRQRDGRDSWHPEQSITVGEAITASSRTVVAVGEVADLVLTDIDPASASDGELRAMPVAATLLGGRFTHTTL